MNRAFYELIRSAPKGRWNGIQRNYGPEQVHQLRSGVQIEYTLATIGANKLWKLLETEPYVHALGAITGNQAMQMVRAGLRAIYLSGWQVAADGNTAGSMYPDQSLYPANSGPELARRINKTLERASQIEQSEGGVKRDWFAPIVADAEAGFGGALNCFEIMKAYIEAGAAGVHFEDQLAAEKKCGHLGGKERGMTAYSELQQAEFDAEKNGYTAVRHQREVGTGYFDLVTMAVAGGKASTTALSKSTETAQFTEQAQSMPAGSPSVHSQAAVKQQFVGRMPR
ncbi:unnamed protein product [Rotaria sp. Silwood1]|nr:unnamed protein product [Rotaria sp. Silwood1]CAF1447859.1 unnamed protein product [Rotaria sp. Silwood1]